MVDTVTRRKTSFEIDTAKVQAAKEILGTTTLTDTVDAALSEVVRLRQRRDLVTLLADPSALELQDPDVMAGAWRHGGVLENGVTGRRKRPHRR
jgi:Arc/MetJ family transcription regulator